MWWLRIVALGAVGGAVTWLYAVEGSYFIPAIYHKGLSPIYGSMLLCLSPMLGVLFQFYLGSASDQCKCRWGRRRPFILALTITCVCGLILFPFTKNIANLLSEERLRFVLLLILTVLATAVTDFSVGNLSMLGKAYLLDVLPKEYTRFGNIVYAIWVSAGATIGFGIGGISWSSNFSIQIQIVFGISVIITVVCNTLTLFSVNEQNPQLNASLKTEAGQVSTVVNEDHGQQPTVSGSQQADVANVSESSDVSSLLSASDRNYDPHNELDKNIITDNNIKQTDCGCTCRCIDDFVSSIIGNLRFLRRMSSSMIILFFATFFGFLAVFTQLYFFTDFVANVIYDGDVTAPENSTAYHNYTKGVKVGSLALGVSAISSLAVSLLSGPAMKLFGMRPLLVFAYVFLMLQSGVMVFSENLIILFVLTPAVYFLLTILLLIPCILVSEYEAKSILLRKPWPYADKHLIGRACSILMIAVLSSDIVALMINGPIKHLYGSAKSMMIISSGSSFIGAVIACFEKVPSDDGKKNTNLIVKHKTVNESTKLFNAK